MKFSTIVSVLVGFMCIVVAGCEISESGSPQNIEFAEEKVHPSEKEVVETSQASMEVNREEYVTVVEDKLTQLNDDHAKLVGRAQQAGPGTQIQEDLDTILNDLTKQGKEVQQKMDELKSAKVEDWNALQSGMNQAMEKLGQSYDQALTKYAS